MTLEEQIIEKAKELRGQLNELEQRYHPSENPREPVPWEELEPWAKEVYLRHARTALRL